MSSNSSFTGDYMKEQEGNRHALYMEVYKKIKEDIILGKYPAGSLLPTEMELADAFFVSRITIQKAMQLLKKEGYISRTPGRGTFVETIPTKPHQHTIGLILCNIAYSFGLNILMVVERTAAAHGYHVIFKNSIDSLQEETKAINDLVAFGVEGIIIQPVHSEFYNETLVKLHFRKFPIVLVDRYFAGFNIPSVSTNNFEAAQAVTQYLFDKGHERIGFLCSPQANTSSVQERLDGFSSMYITNRKDAEDYQILNTIMSPHSSNDSEVARRDIDIIKDFLLGNPGLTALISSEFSVTRLLMTALHEIGKSVPDDYSLIMFDSYESVTLPLFTHVYQDQEEIGRIAFETLLETNAEKQVANKIYVPFKIIEGNTVKDLRASCS